MTEDIPLAIQSYCFRDFADNREVASKVRELGLQQIEICNKHGNFNSPKEWKETVGIYRDNGIDIVSLGVQTFTGRDEEKEWFECAARAGAKHISAHFRIDSYMGAIAKVRAWSREFGVRVGIHPHGGYMFGGQPDVLRHLLMLGAPEIGICLDTAWVMQIGPGWGDPVKWLKEFSSSIYGIHYKDFLFQKNGQWNDVVIGNGTLDLRAFVGTLNEIAFDGVAILEYEGDRQNPVPVLRQCIEAIQGAMA